MSEENPSKTPIQDEMRRIEREKALTLYHDQAVTAALDEDGEVVAPDIEGPRLYIDPNDGQIHQKQPGQKLPPHARAA